MPDRQSRSIAKKKPRQVGSQKIGKLRAVGDATPVPLSQIVGGAILRSGHTSV